MEFRTLGANGGTALEVSVVGLGCNAFGRRIDFDATRAVLHAALDAGITLFDTADTYGGGGVSEEYMGRVLSPKRHDIVLASKFGLAVFGGPGGAAPAYIESSIEGSLKRLGTDYIDLYQVHMPDAHTPIADTLGTLDGLVRQGKIRAYGCSNFSGAQLEQAHAAAAAGGLAPFVTAQNPYSVMQRDIESDLVPVCAAHRTGILPYYPLARGLLTGKYRRGEKPPEGARLAAGGGGRGAGGLTDANFDVVEKLAAFAAGHGRSVLELAISWLVANPCIASVIAGATKPAQIGQNVAAAGWRLDDRDMAEIDRITAG
jgi:aryl-alcohol dehydrogenase-like predicted oxidoreductase